MTRVLMFGLVFITMAGILGASCQAAVTTAPSVTTPTPPVTTTTTPTPTPTLTLTPTPQAFNVLFPEEGSGFLPMTITVPVGTTVIWSNKDHEEHTITSDTGLFDGRLSDHHVSGPMLVPFSYTFTERGTFNYHCVYHPEEVGKVIVE